MNWYTLAKSGLKVMLLVSVVALAVIAATASPAQAQYTCPPDNAWCGCVNDFLPGSNCTANDVQIATMSVHETIDTCGYPGDTGRFKFRVNAVSGADERYDIGFFIGLDGGSALASSRLPNGASCYHGYLPPPLSFTPTPYGQIRYSPFYNAETTSDTCGDIEAKVTTSYVTEEISVTCVDNNGDGVVDDVSTCVSWDNQKNNTPVCTTVAQAYPNNKSKCRCDYVPIPTLVIRKIVVDKVTYPAGDPTPFNFTLTGPSTNIAFSLTDAQDPYISPLLARATYAVAETVPEGWVLTKAECTNGLTTFQPNNIPLTENREVRCTFYNKKLEGGGKFVDLNWNSREDAGEKLLGGWPIRITNVDNSSLVYDVTTRTSSPEMGRWFFPANLPPGVYTVEEVAPSAPDYFQTYPNTNNGVYRIQYNGAQPGEGPTFTPLFQLLSEPPTGFHELDFGNVWVDFGDLPDGLTGFPSYPTTLAHNGARHTLDGRYLGAGVDAECNGCPCSCCGGDDANRPVDDEDGVVFSSMSNWAEGPGVVDVTVGGGAGCLNAWLDFTDDAGGGVGSEFRDGEFDDVYVQNASQWSEWIIQNRPLAVGTTSISFALPPGFLGNEARSYYFRFRFTPRDANGGCANAEAYVTGGAALASLLPGEQTGGVASPLGLAIGGEVEDYRLDLSPLAVTLASFAAEATPDGVALTWETVSETDNAGFNIYRADSEAGPWTRLNTTLIPAAAPGSAQGALYTWTDTAAMSGLTYWYMLEDVALNGATTRHAPVVVTVVAPNALQVTNLAAASGSVQAVPLVTLVSALVSGFVLARRRRR